MERDDIIEYSLDTHHSEEAGKSIRKRIWTVTAILSAITAIEVVLGAFIKHGSSAFIFIKWGFIAMTVVKAGYIVSVFMHLGEERRNLRNLILIPYFIFILYIIFIILLEGSSYGDSLRTYGA